MKNIDKLRRYTLTVIKDNEIIHQEDIITKPSTFDIVSKRIDELRAIYNVEHVAFEVNEID